MKSETKTASINDLSQEMLKKEDSRALDRVNQHKNEFTNPTKIFVGGLPADLTKEEFKAYFEKFGSIEDVVVMSDKETNRPRRFGFVTFDSPDTAKTVLKNRYYELKNKRVEVKKAVSKERMTRSYGNYYDTYKAMYNGNTLPYATGNYGGYYYGMNSYGYGAYSGLGYEGLSCLYYPYQNIPNPSYYDNTCSYQNPFFYADTYSYQSPYNYYGNAPKHSYKCRSRTPVVIKKKSNVNNGGGDHDVRKNVKLNSEVNNEESVVRDVIENGDGVGDNAEISDGLGLCRNCKGEGGGGCAEGIQALSLCSDGSGEQMGADGESSSCTIDS